MGDVIRDYRERRGLSKTRLARRSGVSLSLISRIESHQHRSMTPDNVTKIAHTLHVSVDDIYRRTGIDDGQPRNDYPFEEWLARDPNLTDRQRAALLGVYHSYIMT